MTCQLLGDSLVQEMGQGCHTVSILKEQVAALLDLLGDVLPKLGIRSQLDGQLFVALKVSGN